MLAGASTKLPPGCSLASGHGLKKGIACVVNPALSGFDWPCLIELSLSCGVPFSGHTALRAYGPSGVRVCIAQVPFAVSCGRVFWSEPAFCQSVPKLLGL